MLLVAQPVGQHDHRNHAEKHQDGRKASTPSLHHATRLFGKQAKSGKRAKRRRQSEFVWLILLILLVFLGF